MRRWPPLGVAGAVALMVGGLGGCTRVPQVGDPAPKVGVPALEKAYQSVFEAYSGQAQVYAGFDTRLFAGATYQSWPFREARIRRQGEFQGLPETVVQSLLEQERAEHQQYLDVFLGVHFNDIRNEDLDKPQSIWRLALVNGSREVTPLEMKRLGRATQDGRAYYAYLGDFWVAYHVRFPRVHPDGRLLVEPGAPFVFRMGSSLGRWELAFRND